MKVKIEFLINSNNPVFAKKGLRKIKWIILVNNVLNTMENVCKIALPIL